MAIDAIDARIFLQRRDTAEGSKYGRTLIGWCIYQHIRYGANLSQISVRVKETFGINIPVQNMFRFKALVASHYASRYLEILHKIVAGEVLYVDETPVNLQKTKGFVWVFASTDSVYYFYKESREGSFLQEMLGQFRGVLISDFFTAYDALPIPQQKCLIHLMRDLNEDLLKYPFDLEFRTLGQAFSSLLRGIVETIDRYGLRKRHLHKHKIASERFCRWATEAVFHSVITQKYQKRIVKYRDKSRRFLDYGE